MESTLGLRQKFNRLEVTLRGFFERAMYQDALLSDGTTLDLSSTDYNGYGGIVRASYEISPDLKPFIESKVTVRIHDTPVDVFGFYRDSHGMAIKGGAEFRISDFLKGEAAIGYAERKYVDFRLPKLPGTTIDGSLVYTPTALTTVTLRAATNFYETTAANAAGVLNRAFTAEISHDFFRNFTATAQLTYYENNYVGANIFERGFTGGVKLDYKMTRSIWVRASYSHEKLSSTTPVGGLLRERLAHWAEIPALNDSKRAAGASAWRFPRGRIGLRKHPFLARSLKPPCRAIKNPEKAPVVQIDLHSLQEIREQRRRDELRVSDEGILLEALPDADEDRRKRQSQEGEAAEPSIRRKGVDIAIVRFDPENQPKTQGTKCRSAARPASASNAADCRSGPSGLRHIPASRRRA